MNVLHYALGFPPYRSGGMTKYVMDLAEEQAKSGHQVSVLWPGRIDIFQKKISIIYKEAENGIGSYEMINPLPVPLLNGILSIEAFTEKCNLDDYIKILKTINPDVMHIHTFMGLHKEALEAAKRLKIKLIFTSHDYFGLCAKANMVDFEGKVCQEWSDEKCSRCNLSALSLKRIYIMQSVAYRKLKDAKIVKTLRKNYKKKQIELLKEEPNPKAYSVRDYKKIYEYYREMFRMIDVFHFNSARTQRVFCNKISNITYQVLPITNSSIKSVYKKKDNTKKGEIVFGYFGDRVEYKGYWLLLNALDEIYTKRKNFKLKTFFGVQKDRSYIECHNPFTSMELFSVLDSIDVLVVPSVCNETFGMIVPEALCRGVPVILTECVGAADIVPKGGGIVVKRDEKSLREAIESVVENPDLAKKMNDSLETFHTITMKDHAIEMDKLYKR